MAEKTVKLTYTGPSGQAIVGMGPLENGQEVEVSEEIAEDLAEHRWFEGGSKKKATKEEAPDESVDAAGIAAQVGSGPNFTGTAQSTMDFWVPVESGAPGPNFQEMEADETIGSRFPTDREIGGIYYEPTMAGKVRDRTCPGSFPPSCATRSRRPWRARPAPSST